MNHNAERVVRLSSADRRKYEELTDRFDGCWNATPDSPPDLRDFVPANEPLRRAVLIDLIRSDLEMRLRNREPKTVNDYLAQFPELSADDSAAGELAEYYKALEQPPSTTDVVPGYEVLRKIGEGGMGVVWRVRDPQFDRHLAAKLLKPSLSRRPDLVQRFLAEARITSQLTHPGMVPVHSMGRLPDGRPYYTMKLVEGQTFSHLLQSRPDPSARTTEFLQIFLQTCQTLAFAHDRGILHRDLKPDNIMVGSQGEVQVMDWGLSKILKSVDTPTAAVRFSGTPSVAGHVTQAGDELGTLPYMPPEQARGQIDRIDRRSDVFGLGAILCQILTGKPPYVGSTPEVQQAAIGARLEGAHERIRQSDADQELKSLAESCLAAEKDDRLPDAAAVANAVASYLAGVQERLEKERLDRAQEQLRAGEERKRRRVWMGMILVSGLLAIIALSVTVLLRARQDDIVRSRTTLQLMTAGDDFSHTVHYSWRAFDEQLSADSRRDFALRKIAWNSQYLASPFQHSRPLDTVALSANGVLATGSADKTVRLWNLATRTSAGQALIHPRGVTALSFSPDGSNLATGCDDNTVRVWNTKTCEPTDVRLEHDSSVTSLSFSPDGKRLLSGTSKSVQLWDLATGRQINQHPVSDYVKVVAFSPDGERCAVGTHQGYLHLLEVPQFEAVWPKQPVPHYNERYSMGVVQNQESVYITSLTFLPNGETLAVGTYSGLVFTYDVETGERRTLVEGGHSPSLSNSIATVATSPDGQQLLTGASEDKLVLIRSTQPPYALQASILHGDPVKFGGYFDHGQRFVTVTSDGTIRVWTSANVLSAEGVIRSTPGPAVEGPFQIPFPTFRLNCDADGTVWFLNFQYSGSTPETSRTEATVNKLDSQTGIAKSVQSLGPVVDVRMGARTDGTMTVVAARNDGLVYWDSKTGNIRLFSDLKGASAVAVGAKRTLLASIPMARESVVSVVDAADGKVRATLSHPGVVTAMCISPDEGRIVTSTLELTRLWTADGRLLGERELTATAGPGVPCFSPDGQTFAVCETDNVHVLSSENCRLEGTLAIEGASILSFTPDGKTLLVGAWSVEDQKYQARFWDVETRLPWGKEIPTSGEAVISADGSKVATTTDLGHSIRIWRIPRPAVGDKERLRLSVEFRTGLAKTTESEGPERLTLNERLQRYARLKELGGPCDLSY